jgi:hypothetical protein
MNFTINILHGLPFYSLSGKHSIGTRLTKIWDEKPYTGTVISNTDTYYKVKYDDNDEEELNHTEV